jgi:hypothetical protein
MESVVLQETMHFCWQDLEALKCVHESEKEHGL